MGGSSGAVPTKGSPPAEAGVAPVNRAKGVGYTPSRIKGPELEVNPSGDLVPVIGRDSGLSLF